MTTQPIEVGATGVHETFRLRSSSSDRIERLIIGRATWIVILATLVIAVLPHPDNRYEYAPVILWALAYAAYTVCLHLLRRWLKHSYDHPLFTEIRIHFNIVMVSILVWITGGIISPFWPFYVLPTLAAIIYSRGLRRTVTVTIEVLISYYIACAFSLLDFLAADLSRLAMNSAAITFLALLLKYLVDLIRGHSRYCLETAQSIQTLASSLDPVADLGQLSRSIVQRIVEAVKAGDGTLMLFNRETDSLEMWAKYSRLHEELPKERFALGEGIAGQVAQKRKPKLVIDTVADEGFASPESDQEIGSLISVPVLSQDRTVGVLTLDSPQASFFNENDLWMLQAYAATVADKLIRAKMLQALQSLRENATSDITGVLRCILDLLAQILPYDSGTVFLLDGTRVKAEEVHRHPHPELARELAFNLEEDALFSEMVEQRKAWLILNDAQQDRRFRCLAQSDYVRSWMAVSLTASGRVIGFLSLDSREEGFYAEADAQLVSVFGAHAAAAIQDARLREDRKRRIEQLQILHEATRAMVSQTRLEAIAHSLMSHLDRLFDADSTRLLIPNERTGNLKLQTVTSDGESPLLAESEKAAKQIATEVWRSGRARLLDDIPVGATAPRGTAAVGFAIRSVLAVPVMGRERMIGVLELLSRRKGYFSIEHRHLLEAASDSLATALDNSGLVAQLEEEQGALKALHDGSVEIASQLAEEDLLRSIISRAAGLVEAVGGAIYLLDDEKKRLTLAVCHGLPSTLEGMPIAEGDSATWQAIRSQKPFIRSDYLGWEHRLDVLEPYALAAVVAVPMMWRDQPLGAIVVHNTAPERPFTSEDAELLQAFASHAATVISHSKTLADNRAKSQYLADLIKHALDGIIAVDPHRQRYRVQSRSRETAAIQSRRGLGHTCGPFVL